MKIVSYSLFGPASIYTYGAVRNACMVGHDFYHGWVPRFYFTNSVPLDIRALIRFHGGQLNYVDPRDVPSPIFGRLLVMADPEVDAWVCREAESRPTWRDALLVREWMDSGLPWHVIKDHSGGAIHPVGTGSFGGRGPLAKVPNVADMAFAWAAKQSKAVTWTENKPEWFLRNQEFVRDCLWPKILKDGVLVHWSKRAREANRAYPHFEDSERFSRMVPLSELGYVGEAYGMDERPLHPCLRNYQ